MQNKIKQKKKARAYVRVSTLKESQKDSPEHQEGLIREEAAREDIVIDHVYEDRGTATTIIGRDDVQRMIQDAKSGEFDTIYFASLSRFSRDALDALSLKRILVNALGVRLVSIEDTYDSAKEDNEMIFNILSSVNQKQSESISKASKRGIRQSAKNGNFTGSIAPYGYKKVTVGERKTLEIIPEEAEVVRMIFELYVNNGYGEKAIVNYLNNESGISSPKGGIWGLSTIQRILKNENYTGYLVFSKYETVQVYDDIEDLQKRRKKLNERSEGNWERTEFQTHDPIITLEMFHKAKDVRLVRGGGKRGGRRAFVNVFAKMVFCKHCGSAMVTMGSTSSSNGKSYKYLMCSKRRRQGAKGCENSTWIPYFDFRDQIISAVIERLKKAIEMDDAEKSIHENTVYSMRDYDKDIKKLEKLISDDRRLLFEIRRQHMLGEITDEQYEFEKEQYEQEIEDASHKIKTLNRKAEDQKDRERLKHEVSQALNQLTSLDDYEDVNRTRNTLIKLIERIEVSKTAEVDIYSVLGKV